MLVTPLKGDHAMLGFTIVAAYVAVVCFAHACHAAGQAAR